MNQFQLFEEVEIFPVVISQAGGTQTAALKIINITLNENEAHIISYALLKA